jgi:predicted N-acetyltransferase YhbS
MFDAATDPAPAPIDAETPADAEAAERLVLAAFGPGRFAKTAERLREGVTPTAGFVARDGDRLIGSVRLWPIRIGGQPALFLGPIAVDAASRRGGVGADLVQACLDRAAELGLGVLLVGDTPYFGRFGFTPAPAARLQGPVDPSRVLWRGAQPAPEGEVHADR